MKKVRRSCLLIVKCEHVEGIKGADDDAVREMSREESDGEAQVPKTHALNRSLQRSVWEI